MAVVLIIAATFVVYWPALRNGFVWDDTALVLRDPLLRSWYLIPEGFRHFLFLDATASDFYRPLQRLTFVADYQFYGFTNPGGWHFTSVLIHAGAAVALFFLAEKLLAGALPERFSAALRRGLALAVALFWALHPLHTSAVTYVAGRADPLAALFGFIGLALALVSLESSGRPWLWRLGAALGFTLAFLSKESGGTFLLIWLLILIWKRTPWKTVGTWLGIFALVLGFYWTLRSSAEHTSPPKAAPIPVAIRPILAARAWAEYASLLVAPVTLRMERDVGTHPLDTPEATLHMARLREYQTLAGILLLIGFGLWWRFAWSHQRTAALCLSAFLLAYLPISNLLSLNATIAEHWLYVPSAFLFVAVAISLSHLLGRQEEESVNRRRLREGLVVLGGLWLVLLGGRAWLRQGDWRDQRTFIEHTIADGGNSPRMLMNLANVESAAGNPQRAMSLYHEALRRSPDQPIIWLGFTNILLRTHDFAGARAALAHAETSPLVAGECYQLHALLNRVETGQDADGYMSKAIAVAPKNWTLRKFHLEDLLDRGEFEVAVRELRDFISAYPFRADSWKMMGGMLETIKQPALAIGAYQEAALRDVRDAESRASLARLQAGR